MNIGAFVIKTYHDVRASYWFIPSVMVVLAGLLAMVTVYLDQTYNTAALMSKTGLPFAKVTGAQAVLTTIAGSVIGVAGVVFSTTMVAVSFAGGTYGPRLIGNFMRDRGNQTSLGVFISTFLYALLVLRTVHGEKDATLELAGIETFIPHLSIAVAMLMMFGSLCTLIFFIHHIPETINIENIVAKLGATLNDGIEDLFPKVISGTDKLRSEQDSWLDHSKPEDAVPLKLADDGYIQALDLGKLREIAEERDFFIRLEAKPGDFVNRHTKVLNIWAKGEASPKDLGNIMGCFALGPSRTIHQNVEFIVDQLVEIIARALSPGVNDPYTAINCISWLEAGVLHYVDIETISTLPSVEDRVQVKPFLFSAMVSAAYQRSLPYIATDANVALHTLRSLVKISSHMPLGPRNDVVQAQIADLCSIAEERLPDKLSQRRFSEEVARLLE